MTFKTTSSLCAISSDHRSALAKQVRGLYDICRIAGSFCSHSSDNIRDFWLYDTVIDDRCLIETPTACGVDQ